jgi:hypothetical protein
MTVIKTCIHPEIEDYARLSYEAADRYQGKTLEKRGFEIERVEDPEEADIVFYINMLWEIGVVINDEFAGDIIINKNGNGEIVQPGDSFDEGENFQRQFDELLEEHFAGDSL